MKNIELLQDIRAKLAHRLPWNLYARVLDLVHTKLIGIKGSSWTLEQTAAFIGRQTYDTKKYFEAAQYLKAYPELGKVSNKRRAFSLISKYKNNSDILRLKIVQEIQNQERVKKDVTDRIAAEGNSCRDGSY